MNPYKPARFEWVTFLLIGPVLAMVMNLLLFSEKFLSSEVLKISFPILFTYLLISWYLHVTVMHFLRLIYPSFSQTAKRVALLFGSHILLTSSTLFLIFYSYDYFHILNYHINYADARWCLVIGILLTCIATGSWEGSYIYQLWKESLHEKELLQKKNLQNEFDALKKQVNPHFLFNSLNSLSSLIQEDPRSAEIFLDEMSSVYRYILKNNELELAEVGTELKFIQSYYHLLKTRYNDGLYLHTAIDEKVREYLIPPLTLQLLVENAVKHNIILKEEPLQISITNEGDSFLRVTNNLQAKTIKVHSNKVGLSNIMSKYQLFGIDGVKIERTADQFTVLIPLIKTNHENINH